MARAALRCCALGAAFLGAAALPDESALIQESVHVNMGTVVEQLPDMPNIPGKPEMTPEQIAAALQFVMDILRNETIVNKIVGVMNKTYDSIYYFHAKSDARFIAINSSLATLPDKELIAATVDWLEVEVAAIVNETMTNVHQIVKLVNSLPLGEHAMEVRMGMAMAVPMLEEGIAKAVEPVIAELESFKLGPVQKFCGFSLELQANLSLALPKMEEANKALDLAETQVPEIRKAPMAFMMKDIMPQIEKLSYTLLSVNRAMLARAKDFLTHIDDTLTEVADNRLQCQQYSAAPQTGLGVFVALAAAATWLLQL